MHNILVSQLFLYVENGGLNTTVIYLSFVFWVVDYRKNQLTMTF